MNATVSSPSTAATWHIQPQGDRCLIVSFGRHIDAGVGRLCLAVARQLRDARLPGVTDVVPSFVAVAVHYRPDGRGDGPRYAQLAERIQALLAQGIEPDLTASRDIDVPVCYGGVQGPDLDDVARAIGLSANQVIALHSRAGSQVFMLGFAPGHAYIGVHDERLDIPRRASPRTAVPPGSVAVANRQTVIYPSLLPGGWNIIGATPLRLFDPARDPPALLQPGDRIRFTPISAAEFARLRQEAAQ